MHPIKLKSRLSVEDFPGYVWRLSCSKRGINSFVIFERGADVGGTWRDNTYSGCACDIKSHLYSFSFELNPDWTSAYPLQSEIQRYL